VPNKKNAVKKGLGRGFSSLIPTELLDESFDPTAEQDEQISELRQIKIDQIAADPNQPRRRFEESALRELTNSIAEHGVLQPIVVVSSNGHYTIVAGERRWRAAKEAKLDKIPALVRTLSAQHQLELSLIENLHRRDLNPLETATAYLKLRDQFNMTLDDIAKRMGSKSISAVSNKMRLLRLPKIVQDELLEGVISEGQARPLIGLDDVIISEILPQIIKESWSSRKIEQFIVQLKKDNATETPKPKKATSEVHIHNDQIKRISKTLDTKVKISSNSKGAGKITISFKDEDDLRRLENILAQ
jgi:ParB family transcriptional regulator, chromosome partitioning protein